MRKAKVSPSFLAYLDGLKRDQPLELILVGHLVVEALLVELIQLDLASDQPWKWTFPKKVEHCVSKGLVDAARKTVYLRLNDIRNDFAHSLGHRLENRSLSEEWYGLEGVLTEVLNEMYLELAYSLHENGGPDRTGG